nr:hypothetical protein [uncultured Acinetobacter sp.]
MNPKLIITDVRIGSYNGAQIRLVGKYDDLNRTLSISKLLPYNSSVSLEGKSEDEQKKIKALQRHTITVVDSAISFSKWDLHFIEKEHLEAAAAAYYEFRRGGCLKLGKDVERIDIDNVLQTRKLEMSGSVYELNQEDTENRHIALLVSCWAAKRALASVAISTTEKIEITDDERDDFLVPFSI